MDRSLPLQVVAFFCLMAMIELDLGGNHMLVRMCVSVCVRIESGVQGG